MEQIQFKNKSQYALFLRQTLADLLKQDSFNIFLHCVSDTYTHTLKDIMNKVNNIIQTGLNIEGGKDRCPYASI